MDATSIISLAPSPPEICFARWVCLPSSEWAAWWQGVGTVVAVVVALAIALYQNRAQRIVRERDIFDGQVRVARLCAIFGYCLAHCLTDLTKLVAAKDQAAVDRQRRILNAISKWPDTVEIGRLPNGPALAFMTLRAVAADANALADVTLQPMMFTTALSSEFEALRKRAHAEMKAFDDALPEAIRNAG